MNRTMLILFLVLFSFQPCLAEGDNPFVAKKAPDKTVRLPTMASKFFSRMALWQHELNTVLTGLVKRVKEEGSFKSLIPLVCVSFLYGVVHAAGPGHGKIVVFSYFLSRRTRVRKGIWLGTLIALFHALSGITIVLLLYFILKTSYLSSFEAISQKTKLISYALVTVIGILLFIKSLFTPKTDPAGNPKDRGPDLPDTRKSTLLLAVAVGMVPCPGVVIIMLFALSFHMLAVGMVMSLIMAAGMASTITLAGVLSILGQEGAIKALDRKEKARHWIQKGFSVAGSLLVMGFGGILLAGAL